MGNPCPWSLPCGARADSFRSRRQRVSIPSLGVRAFCGFQKVAVSNHGAALTGTDNVPEAHGEPPRPPRAFLPKVAVRLELSRNPTLNARNSPSLRSATSASAGKARLSREG